MATAEPFVSRLEAAGVGVAIIQTGDAFPRQIATVMFSDHLRARPVARGRVHEDYVKASRHYFDAVLAEQERHRRFDEIVAITAKYTGASPDLIRGAFPTRTATAG